MITCRLSGSGCAARGGVGGFADPGFPSLAGMESPLP
jgi:hypothetical protein